MAAGCGHDAETLGDTADHDWLLSADGVVIVVMMYDYVGR